MHLVRTKAQIRTEFILFFIATENSFFNYVRTDIGIPIRINWEMSNYQGLSKNLKIILTFHLDRRKQA